ncbi:MAG: hypothetical protein HUU35_12390 [Armatimonadetes bacterium]|nr:hypothetical protein [Armatimonadota bacterium]
MTSLEAVPSKYVKQKAIKAADEVVAKAQQQLARYEKMKADGKLDKIVDDVPISVDIGRQLRSIYRDALDVYFEAVAVEGWPLDDPDIVKVREKLLAARAQFEGCGMWICTQFGEPSVGEYRNRLEMMRDEAATAAALYRLKEVDKANNTLEWLDKRLAGLKLELEKAEEAGEEGTFTLKHPAYVRTLEVIAKERGSGAALVAETTNARKAIDDEVAALAAMLAECDPAFRLADGFDRSLSGTNEQRLAALQEGVAKLTEFEQTLRPKAEAMLQAFGAKYGTEEQAIDHKIRELQGGKLDYNRWPGVVYRDLAAGLATVTRTRGDIADRVYAEVSRILDGIGEYSEFIRLQTVDKQKPILDLILQLNPDHAQAKERVAGLAAFRAKTAEQIERDIDARQWPAPMKGFGGPGNTDQLATAALAFLRNEAKDGDQVLAVVVTDNWFVFEKDALGRPLTYGLPVLVAYKKAKDAGKDLAEVFELSMLTQQTKMALPWKGSATAGHYWFRSSKIKAMK